jgi:hypothetical protein
MKYIHIIEESIINSEVLQLSGYLAYVGKVTKLVQ